jgi:hypothetical protein
MCGYLKRKTKSNRNWKKMWYVLKDKVVYVYKAPEDNVAVESFPVLGYILDTALYDVRFCRSIIERAIKLINVNSQVNKVLRVDGSRKI